MNKERAGFTKMGFSKPFSCCGHHYLCNMGKGNCVYADIDPETMKNCAAYLRHHKTKKVIDIKETEKGQMSLF